MATRNLKPKNSSDSEGEAEWTFIDTDEGTIETRKDSVTYRKATYSEILKGVVKEDLVEEVDSEPEFEVLASFKFRPKGETFGLGSSAPKPPKNDKTQGDESRREVGDGDDSCSSDDGIMIISSHLTGVDKTDEVGNSKAITQASNDDDEENSAGCLDDKIGDKEADKNLHDDDDDDDDDDDNDDFVITDETESDFKEATMNDTAEPDDDEDDNDDDGGGGGGGGGGEDDDDGNDDDDEKSNEDVESEEEELTESTANSLNASTIQQPMQLNTEINDKNNDDVNDSNVNSDYGFLGIHKGGICDHPEKELDWDSLTFQLLSALPIMNNSTTTIGDDNQSPKSQDDMIYSIQDSDSESNSHSSYDAISQDDKPDETSSFDELSDSADVNMDLSSEPMIPRWFFNADKNIDNDTESFDENSDYIISDTEEHDYEESRLIPKWLFGPSYKVKDVEESVDGDFEFINSDLNNIDCKENEPVIPRPCNPCYKPKDVDGTFNEDFCEPNPLIPRWLFDPNYKIQDLDETFNDDTNYSDYDYSENDSCSDDDSSITLPRWLFNKKFKPPDQDEEGLFSWPSQLFVDIQTFIILLCLTTALGFSIGHGLTVLFGSQSINRNAKLQTMETPTKQFSSPLEDLGLTPEEIAKIDLLKLEDELYQQKETETLSDHLRYDLRELYQSLKQKHYRLLRNQKSTEDRLHISKTMSRYWRLKYDEEKRRNQVTGLPKTFRPKNFSDMAELARKTKLAKKLRRQNKKTHTTPGLEKANYLNSNLKWLVKSLDATLKGKKELGSRYWMKAMALTKNNDMKNFRRRWTQDLKEMKQKSCCSHLNKSIHLQKKSAVSGPFTWVNDSKHCKRAKRSDILNRCATKKATLGKKKNVITYEKPVMKDSGRKNKNLKYKPCFSKPKTTSKIKQTSKNTVTNSSRKGRQKPRKNLSQRSNRQEKVRKERIKKREVKKKSLEIKNQVDELKSVLVELRRERRRAEREKAKLEASWRKLKRQRLQFEKERKQQKKILKKKVKGVKSKLTREKTRLKTWKNIAKRAQKKAQALHKNIKRVSVAKQKLEDIKHIKKDLKLEKRKLRQQHKNLKSLRQQLRKEHRNYARERWKIKKKRRELEKQSFNDSQPTAKKTKAKKEEKTSTYRKKAKKPQREQPFTKRSRHKSKKKAHKNFWENLENSLYNWAQKVNRTIEHHRRGKASRIWKKFRAQLDSLVAWTTGKRSKATGSMKKEKKEHRSRTKVKIKNPVFEKILAEQKKYDEEKRKSKRGSENQWKPKGPVVKERKNREVKKKRKERKKKDPEVLLRQKQRKQRRKYQRELERLQQWALQMNEKKFEHERIYKEKEEKSGKRTSKTHKNPKSGTEEMVGEGSGRFSNSRALISVEESNSTFMLLLKPHFSTSANYEFPESNRNEKPKYRDREGVLQEVITSQINHEMKRKKTDTSLTVPLDDDVIMPPNDVKKGIDVTSPGNPSSQEPTPPSLSPTFYKDFPILRVIDEAKRKKDGSVDMADVLSSGSAKGPEGSRSGDSGQQTESWFMRRAELRDEFRNSNPSLTLFPRPIGPFKSDGTWFFHRSSDRALQRELYEPLNRQSARDGFKHRGWRSYLHRGGRRSALNDGKWVFDRAHDRAEQRANNEPWYMRRAEGREEDREESKDSWFVERGFDRDMLHDYDEDDEDDDLMNDYDDFADQDYEEYYNSW